MTARLWRLSEENNRSVYDQMCEFLQMNKHNHAGTVHRNLFSFILHGAHFPHLCRGSVRNPPVCPVAFTFLLLLQEHKLVKINPLQETQKMQVPLGVCHLRTINYLRVLYRRESILAIVVFLSLPLFSQAKSCFSALSFWVNISLE